MDGKLDYIFANDNLYRQAVKQIYKDVFFTISGYFDDALSSVEYYNLKT